MTTCMIIMIMKHTIFINYCLHNILYSGKLWRALNLVKLVPRTNWQVLNLAACITNPRKRGLA